MLTLTDIHAGYKNSEVLNGVSLHLGEGEVVALLGRNGMGKTTTINCICGLLAVERGAIEFRHRNLTRMPSFGIALLGIGLVPEERQIFPNLSVRENLLVAAANFSASKTPWRLDSVYALFPRLAERQHLGGHQLSGGEQQMLAIGRALMINPHLLILDEATEGLAPLICREIWAVIDQLKHRDQSILIVDKNLGTLLEIADRYYLMEKGCIVSSGDVEQLAKDKPMQLKYLGV